MKGDGRDPALGDEDVEARLVGLETRFEGDLIRCGVIDSTITIPWGESVTCTSMYSDDFQNTRFGIFRVLNLTLRAQGETAGRWTTYVSQGFRGRLGEPRAKERVLRIVCLAGIRADNRSLAGLG